MCCYETTGYGYRLGVAYGVSVIWGFALSPNGPPPGPDIDSSFLVTRLHEGESADRHLQDGWYIWEYVIT